MIYSAEKSTLDGHFQLLFGKGGLRHVCCHKVPDTTYTVDTAADMMAKFAAFAEDFNLPDAASRVRELANSLIE